MEQIFASGELERRIDLQAGLEDLCRGEGPGAGEQVVEVLAANVRHGKEVQAVRFFDIEDGDDVRMAEETGCVEGFATEAGEHAGIPGELLPKHLDGEERTVSPMTGQVYRRHATKADQVKQIEPPGEYNL